MSRFTPAPLAWRLLRPVGDLVAAVAAFYLAFVLRLTLPVPFTRFLLPPDRIRYFYSEWWLVAASQLAALYFFGFFDPPGTPGDSGRSKRLAIAVALQGLSLMGFYFLAEREFPRSVLLIYIVLDFLLLALWRGWLASRFAAVRRRVAIIGRGPAARELARTIGAGAARGIEVVGHVPAPDEPTDETADDAPELGRLLGSADDLPDLLARGEIDDLILASSPEPWQARLLDRLSTLRPAGPHVLLLPGPVDSMIGQMRYRWVEDIPLIEVVRPAEWRAHRPFKRLMDVVGAAVLLLLAALPIAIAAVAVKLSSTGPAFYRQTRVGHGRRPFTLWKLRTMRVDAEEETGEVLAEPGDPRITPVGAVLRRLRIDELPQLLNVLSGSMSLVGPRPERPGFVERYLKEVPGYAERFSVPPGITGLAQINGHYHSSAENKLRYDLAYIANRSLWLDASVLVRTIKIVLTSRGT